MEWSVLSIYFYEVQNDKALLLTLCHNESIKDVQWNKWKAKYSKNSESEYFSQHAVIPWN